jgi:hypothetical protein
MFERVAAVMHESSPWMLEEEEGLSGDLTGCSLGRRSDRCSRATKSGGVVEEKRLAMRGSSSTTTTKHFIPKQVGVG